MSSPADPGEPDAFLLIVAHLLRALDVNEAQVARLFEIDAIDPALPEDAQFTAGAQIIVPILEQVLPGLDRAGIRTELLGLDRTGSAAAVAEFRQSLDSGTWRYTDDEAFLAFVRTLVAKHDVAVTPVRPERGEVGRIVELADAVPPELLAERITFTSGATMTAAVRVGLMVLRSKGGFIPLLEAQQVEDAPAASPPRLLTATAPAPAPPVDQRPPRTGRALLWLALAAAGITAGLISVWLVSSGGVLAALAVIAGSVGLAAIAVAAVVALIRGSRRRTTSVR